MSDMLRSNQGRADTTRSLAPNFFFRPGAMEVIACSLTVLVYFATLSFGFVYDDVPQILKNPAVHQWRFVPQYFTSHVWAAIYPDTSGNYYRPVFLLWLRLNYALFGAKAAGWHLTTVLCHGLATWLVFRIAQRLLPDRMSAFAAALIFGLHPAHIENVAWISGVSDPLMACFLLGSFLAFLKARDAESKFPYAAISLGLFALAILSKETAIVLPVLIFAFVLLSGWQEESKFSAAVRSSAPYLALVLVYAFVRFRVLGAWSHPTIPIGWTEVVLTWPAVLWFYASHLVAPFRLSEFYPLAYVEHFSFAAVIWPLIFFLALAVATACLLFSLIGERSRRKDAAFALVLMIVPLLPVLDLHSLTAGDIVHDRYLYLPSVGFALLIALFIRELAHRLSRRRHPLVVPVAAAGIIVLTFAALTIVQQMQWASDILLYTRGIESAPSNLTVRDNLASALLNANKPARAIPLYLEVLQTNPTFWRSNYNLGFAYYKTVQFQAAEDYFQRAIRIDPSDSDQYIYLALSQLELKKLPRAAENASRAIARSPHTRGYHFVLGMIDKTAGDYAGAANEFRTEVAEHPDNAEAANELQKLPRVSSAQRP